MTRTTLPNRRPCVTVDTAINGAKITIGVGFHPDTGQALEAFADVARGTDQQHTLSDACVTASVALQYGVPLDALEHSMGRVPAWVQDGAAMALGDAPASPVGAVLATVRSIADGVREPGFFKEGA
jgi:hypothetical protein